MKRRLLILSVAVGLMMAMAVPAGAVFLSDNQAAAGIECSGGFTHMHFVHNQHDGEGSLADEIWVEFTNDMGGTDFAHVSANKANRGSVHYTLVNADLGNFPILVDAWDTISVGKLVLSDAKCKNGDPKNFD